MTNLINLSKKIPQTKQTLGYLPLYDLFFDEFKNKKINILEIGIDKGYSLKLWSKYFKKAKIVGIDINKIDLKYQNVELFFGDQTDINFLSKIISKYKKFDIIIDDGSHVSKHIC
jgi:23S rRNA U2552 (ribose-2'-O)-methylase RlmE/FtsJ